MNKTSVPKVQRVGSFTHRFNSSGIAKVVQSALLCDLLNDVFPHFKIHEVAVLALRFAHKSGAHLHELVVAEVGKAPRIVRIKATGKTGVRCAEHRCHLILVSGHNNGAIFRRLHFFDNGVQNLIQKQSCSHSAIEPHVATDLRSITT